MNCPRCERNSLVERDRDGIAIDVCSSCRGVWLDRGELDKLIARSLRDDGDRFGGDDDAGDEEDGRGRGRRRGFFASLGDIFD